MELRRPPLPEDATYGDICREFVRRACFLHRLSKPEVAERLGIDANGVGTQVYRGQLAFDRAMNLAELAEANDEERSALEAAWLDKRAGKDARSYLRRTFRMLSEYRAEVAQYDAFLKEKGLREEYTAWADRADVGVTSDASSEET